MQHEMSSNTVGRKARSPSQVKEMKEGKGVAMGLFGLGVFSLSMGALFTIGGLKLIKWIVGVQTFGLHWWTLFGIHTALAVICILASFVIITLVVFVAAFVVSICWWQS